MCVCLFSSVDSPSEPHNCRSHRSNSVCLKKMILVTLNVAGGKKKILFLLENTKKSPSCHFLTPTLTHQSKTGFSDTDLGFDDLHCLSP